MRTEGALGDEAVAMAESTATTGDRPGGAVAPAPPVRGTFYAVGRYREFRFLWAAGIITQLGQWLQNVALGWLALILTDSPAFVGRVSFATGLPILLLSLPAGALLDRVDRRRALLICQILGATLAGVVALVIARGQIAPWQLLLAAVLSGGLVAFAQPATQTLVPALVPREDLPNALALSSAGNSSARIVGPSLAGALIAGVGIASCFLSQGIALLLAAALTLAARPRVGAWPGGAVGGGLLDGLRHIRRDRTLTGLLLLAGAPALLAYPYIPLLPVFARDVLHLGPRGLGLLMAGSGIGAVSGALTVARLGARAGRGRLTIIVGIAYGIVLSAFALSPWPVLSGLILMCSTGLGSVYYSLNQIIVQTHAREELRGRVLGALALTFGLQPVGSLFIGELAQHFGAPAAVVCGALSSSLCIGLLALHYRMVLRL